MDRDGKTLRILKATKPGPSQGRREEGVNLTSVMTLDKKKVAVFDSD